jgi:predicted Abi (CAAX) family protease
VLTSIYCDLASDEKLFAPLGENAERNRRVLAPVLLLLGAVIGGLWAHSEVGMTGALWTAVALKLIVVLAWCFWVEEKDEEE